MIGLLVSLMEEANRAAAADGVVREGGGEARFEDEDDEKYLVGE